MPGSEDQVVGRRSIRLIEDQLNHLKSLPSHGNREVFFDQDLPAMLIDKSDQPGWQVVAIGEQQHGFRFPFAVGKADFHRSEDGQFGDFSLMSAAVSGLISMKSALEIAAKRRAERARAAAWQKAYNARKKNAQ